MKRHLFVIMVIFSLLAFAGTGWSVPMADVGGLDTLYTSALLENSGYPTELAWIQLVLGPAYTFAEEDIYDTATGWEMVDGTDYYAHMLDGTPEYYYIKIGTGSLPEGTPDHYLYLNNPEYDWAVLDISVFGDASNVDIFRISHIGEVGQVPEPGSLLLLGVGMVGLVGFRKKFA